MKTFARATLVGMVLIVLLLLIIFAPSVFWLAVGISCAIFGFAIVLMWLMDTAELW